MSPGFRTGRETGKGPESPEALFRELRPKDSAIRDLLSRQADVLREYHALPADLTDVALELPTGAGKTLVGLLLADFRRRTENERAAYLCPTKQLAWQVARKAEGYGLPAVCLVGSQRRYDPADWNSYVRANAVAVTTYSGVFNSSPRIDNAQTLVLDDAHAGEGYVSDLWSMRLERGSALYGAVLTAIAGGLSRGFAERLLGGDIGRAFDALNVELVAPTVVGDQADLLREAIAVHTSDRGDPLYHRARMLGGHVEHCLIYVSPREILIRPLISPTTFHRPFADANQRIYMSATLGAGGELERAFGVEEIRRLPLPPGAEKQGLGRRFFLFPGATRPEAATTAFVREAIDTSERTVVIAPSNRELELFKQDYLPPGLPAIEATAVEEGFDAFIAEPRAALMLANRYDGMDLPDDACRLVVLTGLPAYTHLQERFILDRLLSGRVIAERIRTRITQGAGRCTRNAKDYAAVIVHGDRLVDFCSSDEEVRAMLPELQAEIEFGLRNSDGDADLLALLRLFFAQGSEWADADSAIREQTLERDRVPPAGIDALQNCVRAEVAAWREIWRGDTPKAVELAQKAVDSLMGVDELRGYRALWLYLAASWATELADDDTDTGTLAASLREEATKAAGMLPWYPRFDGGPERVVGTEYDARAARAAATLLKLKIRGDNFEEKIKEFSERLAKDEASPFELGLETLGELLGFESVRRTGTATPDCAWRDGEEIWFVFEAKTEEKAENPISASEVRQALTHPSWVANNLSWEEPTELVNILVSHKRTVESATATLAEQLRAIEPTDVRKIGEQIVTLYREIRAGARGLSEDTLAAQFSEGFRRTSLTTQALKSKLGRYFVSKLSC